MSGGPFLDWKQYILCTKNQVEDTRLEPCDWPASHRTCFWLDTGEIHLDFVWICLYSFQLFLPDFEPNRGHKAVFPLHPLHERLDFTSVRFFGERPTLAASSDHDQPHRRTTYMHTLAYSTIDTDGRHGSSFASPSSRWAQIVTRQQNFVRNHAVPREWSRLHRRGEQKYFCSGAPTVAKNTKPGDPPQVRVEPVVPIHDENMNYLDFGGCTLT